MRLAVLFQRCRYAPQRFVDIKVNSLHCGTFASAPNLRSAWKVKAAWRDNVFVEQLWSSIKYEEEYLRAIDSFGATQ